MYHVNDVDDLQQVQVTLSACDLTRVCRKLVSYSYNSFVDWILLKFVIQNTRIPCLVK